MSDIRLTKKKVEEMRIRYYDRMTDAVIAGNDDLAKKYSFACDVLTALLKGIRDPV
ncbi:MAG TPA: hypothetical protein IAA51_06795 [Candidatus Cottocaccamicrobium excrementipullorum]|nr:hypothetical protein [Candidatus Cottocaccamicrobium excrementipullorum]